MKSRNIRTGSMVCALLLLFALWGSHAQADSVPSRQMYGGYLFDAQGRPITSMQRIRFSYWKVGEIQSGDLLSSGAINPDALNFIGWQEAQNFTTDGTGRFAVQMGVTTPFPTSLPPDVFLQVELRPASLTDNAYELLGRQPLLSVPFAISAERVGGRSVGTGSGSIAYSLSGGLLRLSQIPEGTNRDMFVIDADATASSGAALYFGPSLNRALKFDLKNNRFDFSAGVKVQGNLTVTGQVNGLAFASLAPLSVSSGAGLSIKIASGSYRINGIMMNYPGSLNVPVSNNATNYVFFTSTGMVVTPGGFPTDKSFIPLAQVVTANGGVSGVTDRRTLASDDRQQTVERVYHAEYEGASYQPDGSNNVGQLIIGNDASSKKNQYVWTSTRSALQDYDIVLRGTVPSNFVRWQGSPLSVTYKSSFNTSADNRLDILVYDTAGSQLALSGPATSLANTSWTTTTLGFTGTQTWTPGSDFLIRLRLYAKSNAQMIVSDLKLTYVTFSE